MKNCKKNIKAIGLLFSGMIGIVFIILTIISSFSLLFSNTEEPEYIEYDGIVIEANKVESYNVEVKVRSHSSTRRFAKNKIKTETRYRQTIIVKYNNTETKLENISVQNAKGYQVGDIVAVYDNGINTMLNYPIDDNKVNIGLIIFTIIYVIIYTRILCKKR